MSVLVRKRKLSELKFYDNAIRLRRSMTYLLMRDLGAKRGVRDIQWMAKDLPPQDAELLLAVAERNGLKRFETDWPSWVVEKLTGQKFLPKSLGIGSPLSQIAGIFFPTRIDTYCKTVRQLHCYDAYMDDRIILHPDKEYLKRLRGDIEHIAGEMGLFVHPKKTQIIKISHGITFLKTKYLLTDTGRIVRRIPHDTITTERRKLKALARLVAAGKMDYAAFTRQYLSWRGDKEWYNAHRTVRNMDNLYRRLKAWLKQQKKQQARQTPRGNRSLKKSRKSPT